MDLHLINKPLEELNEKTFVQQTTFWSKVKEKQGLDTKAFCIKVNNRDVINQPKDSFQYEDVLVLIQPVDREHCIAYIPYGPYVKTSEENKGAFLEELSEALKGHLPEKCILIRYDLIWESDWAKEDDFYSEDNTWLGPPERRTQEMRINFNTNNWNLKKAPTDILPSNTLLVNLEKDNPDLLMDMKSKTRYNIRLSKRKQVQVKTINRDNLDIWLDLYKETACRNGINYQNPEHFRTVAETTAENYNSPVDLQLLLAEKDDEPLAAMYLALTEKRATYLYGASSSKNRNLMAPYALQWEAIQTAKNYGCKEYDMFGLAPAPDQTHPLYGLYKFKTGFGGEIFHRMGCWDYPLDENKYAIYAAKEMNSQGYHCSK